MKSVNVRKKTLITQNGNEIGGKLSNLKKTTNSYIMYTALKIQIKIFLCLVLATGMILIKIKTFLNLM